MEELRTMILGENKILFEKEIRQPRNGVSI